MALTSWRVPEVTIEPLIGPAVQRVIELVKHQTATLIAQGRWATRFLGDA